MRYTNVTGHLIIIGIMTVCFLFCAVGLFTPQWIVYKVNAGQINVNLLHNKNVFQFLTVTFVFMLMSFIFLMGFLALAMIGLATKMRPKNLFFIDFASTISFTCDFIFLMIYFPATGLSQIGSVKDAIGGSVSLGYSYFMLIPCLLCSITGMGLSGYHWYFIYVRR